MEFEFLVDGVRRTICLDKKDGAYAVRDGDIAVEAEILRISQSEVLVRSGGRSVKVYLVRDGQRRLVSANGCSFEVSEPGQPGAVHPQRAEGAVEGAAAVKAPMPGRVVKICVSEGEEVRVNQALVIVEAMKMENEIRAAAAGTVMKIHVSTGELVDAEKTMIELDVELRGPSRRET